MQAVLQQIEKLVARYEPKDILVAFDIDLTLTQAAHPAMYYPAMQKHKHIYKQIMADLTPAQRDLTLTLHIMHAKQMLVDPNHPATIKEIQRMGCKTMAFTAAVTGNLINAAGEKVRIEHLRYQTLQQLDINFASTFTHDEIIFDSIATHNGNYPTFYKGILFANGEKDATGRINKPSKGGVLVSFLQYVQEIPEVVIMVDDRKVNLTDIEIALRKFNPAVKFVGHEYTAALDIAYEDVSAEDFKVFWQQLAQIAQQN